MSDNDDHKSGDSKIPAGRLSRFARMASLSARTATDLAVGRAKRAMGDDSWSQEKEAAKKVLETLGTMKGAAMKLGQQLAMEADALPPEAREIVSKLFAQAPAMSYEDIAKVVEEELGEAPHEAFAWFDEKPLASASLGQVHRARLSDGTEVAVKVQYPGVAEALINDLKNASILARAMNGATRAFANMDSGPYFEEIRREIGAETDYLREAKLADEFRAAVADVPELHVPRTYPTHSTGRVLTLEFVQGQRIMEFAASDADEAARWRVGRQLALATLAPFVSHRLVHGDPHPGNFLVRPDGRMTILDFGAIKRFTPHFVDGFWGLMEAELHHERPDFHALLGGAGYSFKGDAAKAEEVLWTIHSIAARPLKAETYDWGACRMVPDLRALFTDQIRDVFEIHPPPESLLFFRAIGGLANNLKTLRSNGPYLALCRDLSARYHAAGHGLPPKA